MLLSKEIAGYLDEKEQRDWDLNYEKYKDELAIQKKQLDNESLQSKLLEI